MSEQGHRWLVLFVRMPSRRIQPINVSMEEACMESNTSFTFSVLVEFMYLAGVPTLRQQAELFIRSLRLGANADEPTDSPATMPTTQATPQTTIHRAARPQSQPTRPPPQTIWFRLRPTTRPPIWTTRPPRNTTFLYRRRRQLPIPAGSDYCPSLTKQANNRICPNVCPRGM